MASRIASRLPVALIQMSVAACKESNLKHARELICKAASLAKAEASKKEMATPLIVLPECFNSPYGRHIVNVYGSEF